MQMTWSLFDTSRATAYVGCMYFCWWFDIPTINASKSHCLAVVRISRLVIEPMTLGSAQRAWTTSIKYLGITLTRGKSLAIDSSCVKQSFFAACNSIYAHAKDLEESGAPKTAKKLLPTDPIPCSSCSKYTTRQEDELNASWNSVYRRIFGFNRWESVRAFINGLGRLDLHHIFMLRRPNFFTSVWNTWVTIF